MQLGDCSGAGCMRANSHDRCVHSFFGAVLCAANILGLSLSCASAEDWTDGLIDEDITVTGVLGVDSRGAFRGVKSTKLNPSVYAVLEIEYGDLVGGMYTNASSIAGEIRPLVVSYVNYSLPTVAKFDAIVGVRYYAFIASSDFGFDLDSDGIVDHVGRKGFFESFGSVSRDIGKVNLRTRVYYAPNVFGETGGSLYVSSRVKMPLGKGFSISADVGVNEFEREQFNDEYIDYGVSIFKSLFGFDLYLRYSNTSGLAGTDDEMVAVGIEKAWTLAQTDQKGDYIRRKIKNRDLIGDKAILDLRNRPIEMDTKPPRMSLREGLRKILY